MVFLAEEVALDVESVEQAAPVGDKVLVRLRGRWIGPRPQRRAAGRTVLLVDDDGRRHRFPAIPQPRRNGLRDPSAWSASFAVPAWLAPRMGGGTSLMIGETNVPVPPPSDPDAAATEDAAPVAESAGAEPNRAEADSAEAKRVEPKSVEPKSVEPNSVEPNSVEPNSVEPSRTTPEGPTKAPLPDAGQDETIAALREELQQRVSALARVHGVLADVQAQLDARASTQSRLDSTHRELSETLEFLASGLESERARREETESRALALAAQQATLEQELITVQQAAEQLAHERDELARTVSELRGGLASSEVEREALLGEVTGLRSEVERLGTALTGARENGGSDASGLAQAEALLAEARALTASLREH